MGQPRFLFVTNLDVRRSSTFVWPGSQARPRTSWVAWRLVSANNRELGRGYGVHGDYLACRESILQLQRDIDHVEAEPRADVASGRWTWQAQIRGAAVAVSARPYLREREAWSNLSQFVITAPTAPVIDPVRYLASLAGTPAVTSRTRQITGGLPHRVLRVPPSGGAAAEVTVQ